MKSLICLLTVIFFTNLCYATHIVGGEVYYQYLGSDATTGGSNYKISLRLFRDCNVPCGDSTSVACLPINAVVGIYENGNGNNFVHSLVLPLVNDESLSLQEGDYPPCVTTHPSVCYEVKTYSANITLTDNDIGYVIAYENCCRATTLNVFNDNPYSGSVITGKPPGQPGVTYDCTIPGKNILPTGHNSSAAFDLKKPGLVCYNSRFSLNYSATDPDSGDSLSFAFTSAYTSGQPFPGANDGKPAERPPYKTVTYNTSKNFSGTQPLGATVTLDPVTGQIRGVSPTAGLYVVSVVVYEWRNKVNIAQHRKDFILRVEDCNFPQADLSSSYITCNGFDLTFTNESTAANINSYYWDFGDQNSVGDTSTSPVATYTFPKAGTYKVTLITNKGGECSDTAQTEANIFPGFIADFAVSGSCVQGAFTFTDKSTTIYGIVNSWRWNFGDPTNTGDTADVKNPGPYKYSKTGTVTAQLIVGNSKGCIDTLARQVNIYDKPLITMPFHDTLLCYKDTLQLLAAADIANALYTWTPATNISRSNTANPTVHPQSTTRYYVDVNDGNGCENTDSVLVKVTDKVTLSLGNDSTICLTDTIQLHPATNALSFLWSPSSTLNNSTIENPLAVPTETTTYHLKANIGSCVADGDMTIKTAPYPTAVTGEANPICFGSTTQLKGSFTGTNFTWSPTASLLNANTLTPTAGPSQTTVYTLTARDLSPGGCPKPVSDTVTVVVIPPVQVYAGNDTNIVIGQSLQLNASGATSYRWFPSTGMNNSNISNPVVLLPNDIAKITYEVKGTTPQGCSGIDSITVYQYKTIPEIFIPSAFTPDGDGRNDILKPIVAGMKRFENFSVYNRLGQLLFSTAANGQGWDGSYQGVKQPPGTYVFVVTAIDYLNRPVVRKGTVVLIR